MSGDRKVVRVTRRTQMEELIARHHTLDQARSGPMCLRTDRREVPQLPGRRSDPASEPAGNSPLVFQTFGIFSSGTSIGGTGDKNVPMNESHSDLPHPGGALFAVQDSSCIVQSSSAGTPTREVYEPLQRAFGHFNVQLFDARIPRCLLTIQRNGARVYGYYSPRRFVGRAAQTCDEIAMNPMYFACRLKTEVLATLVHEMVHGWQQHFGKPGRGRYHNAEWAAKMKSVGLHPSAAGHPGGEETGDSMSHYIVSDGRYQQAARVPALEELVLEWSEACVCRQTAGGLGSVTKSGPSPASRPSYDRTNRVRYDCPGCRSKAWGKPALSLMCVPCKMVLNQRVRPDVQGPSVQPSLAAPMDLWNVQVAP